MPPSFISGDIGAHDALELKAVLVKIGINRIDTAARYANGESEKKIGRGGFAGDFLIDTKINTNVPTDGTLTPEAIDKSLTNSLAHLGVKRVNVLYCHVADLQTPVSEQAKAMDEQYRKGRFEQLGVSNFPVSMIEEWLDIAEKNGYVKPQVYEGQYNLLSRGYESQLFPLLRKNNMSFNAFSPLAGGFLLGNFTSDSNEAKGSRFSTDGPFMRWYNHRSMHEAIKRLKEVSRKSGIGMDELSLRWLCHHSALRDQDGMILGSSKLHQIENNASQIRNGPLEKEVVKELDALWDGVKEDGMKIVDHSNYLMGSRRK